MFFCLCFYTHVLYHTIHAFFHSFLFFSFLFPLLVEKFCLDFEIIKVKLFCVCAMCIFIMYLSTISFLLLEELVNIDFSIFFFIL